MQFEAAVQMAFKFGRIIPDIIKSFWSNGKTRSEFLTPRCDYYIRHIRLLSEKILRNIIDY